MTKDIDKYLATQFVEVKKATLEDLIKKIRELIYGWKWDGCYDLEYAILKFLEYYEKREEKE